MDEKRKKYIREYMREYLKDKERRKKHNACIRRYQATKEGSLKIRKQNDKWRKEHPEYMAKYGKKWRKEHPTYMTALCRRLRKEMKNETTKTNNN